MKAKWSYFLMTVGISFSSFGQGFTNLDFESANVVPNDPNFGFLDWNQAAPGWDHSDGDDTSIVYYGSEHLGDTQYYLLVDDSSPYYDLGSQLAGSYSLAFSSGRSGIPGEWVQAYVSQTGFIPSDTQSFRFLATGSFEVLFNGEPIDLVSLGNNAFAGGISDYANTTAEFKIVNTSLTGHDHVIADNIQFSPLPVPEPSIVALLGISSFMLFAFKRGHSLRAFRKSGLNKHPIRH